jgi:hypothetical protein
MAGTTPPLHESLSDMLPLEYEQMHQAQRPTTLTGATCDPTNPVSVEAGPAHPTGDRTLANRRG